MEIWILAAAIVVPVVVTIFGDDLRKLRRWTGGQVWSRLKAIRSWLTTCDRRQAFYEMQRQPLRFFENRISEGATSYWSTQYSGGAAFSIGVMFSYRGFALAVGYDLDLSMDWGVREMVWAVARPAHLRSGTGQARSLRVIDVDQAMLCVDSIMADHPEITEWSPSVPYRLVQAARSLRTRVYAIASLRGG